jgi:hypothetical protein
VVVNLEGLLLSRVQENKHADLVYSTSQGPVEIETATVGDISQ